ncbi:MAG: hypothetical protein FJ147_14530 [Deltaproteobacteria bacterium]|nr:hypothetical protein [Deltaproteobacteria bacterium]
MRVRDAYQPGLVVRGCDYLICAGIGTLIVCTPLAFGTVRLWAISLMEALVFFLALVWMSKLVILEWQRARRDHPASETIVHGVRKILLPLWLFVVFGGVQLVPLPPGLLSYLSPATHELYTRSLPGWPEQIPYVEWLASEEASNGADSAGQARDSARGETPLPISVAPSMTYATLLTFLAYATLFSLILCYPIANSEGRDQGGRILSFLLITIVISGFLVATIGIVQRYWWNGKILWVLVPSDWDGPRPDIIPRASGPFVNSDHFANYLALIWPLALCGVWKAEAFVVQRWVRCWRLFCVAALLTIGVGVLLSVSRGGWLGVIGGSAVCWYMLSHHHSSHVQKPQRLRSVPRWLVPVGGVLAFFLVLAMIGSEARRQITLRIERTVGQQSGLHDRVAVWQDSLRMVTDFPVVGVGLGAWSELFPRYQRPPWNSVPWREAHNDYVQCLTEAGIIGTVLLGWFFVSVGVHLLRGLRTRSTIRTPAVIGVTAALGVMSFHAGFDFVLQIPANALLFTILLAIGLRFAKRATEEEARLQVPYVRMPLVAAGGFVSALLCVLAFSQPPYAGIRDINEIR